MYYDTLVDELIESGFPDEVINALKLLTHDEGVDYFEYIQSISKNQLASKVKLADLKHNSDISRLKVVNDKDLERLENYKKAIRILEK